MQLSGLVCIAAMPQCLLDYLAAMKVRIEEELAFLDGSSIYARIVHLGCCSDGPGDSFRNESSLCNEASSTTYNCCLQVRQATVCMHAENDSMAAKKRRSVSNHSPDAALMARFVQSVISTALIRAGAVCTGLMEAHAELKRVPGTSWWNSV